MTRIPTGEAFGLLAAAVASGLPTPETLTFSGDFLMARFATIADGRRWLEHFGADPDRIVERLHLDAKHTLRRHLTHSPLDEWHGWFLGVTAMDDEPVLVTSDRKDLVPA